MDVDYTWNFLCESSAIDTKVWQLFSAWRLIMNNASIKEWTTREIGGFLKDLFMVGSDSEMNGNPNLCGKK